MASVFDTLQSELRRIAVAGADAAINDTKLSKIAEELKSAGIKAPVLARLAEQTEQVLSPQNTNRPRTLLDESMLLTSIAYTQAATEIQGTLDMPQAEGTLLLRENTYRDMATLMEALSTKGGGRYEIIRNAIENGSFLDSRLMPLMVNALEDSYGDIASIVANALPQYGPTVLSRVTDKLDIKKGTENTIRRLTVIARLLPQDEAEPFFMNVYKNGQASVKYVALSVLTGEKYADIHKDALKSKNEAMLRAVYKAYAFRTDQEAENVILAALRDANDHDAIIKAKQQKRDDYGYAFEAVVAAKHPKGLALVREQAEKILQMDTPDRESVNRLHLYTASINHEYEFLLSVLTFWLDHQRWALFGQQAKSGRDNHVEWCLNAMMQKDIRRTFKDIAAAIAAKADLPERTSYTLIHEGYAALSPADFYEAIEPLLKDKYIKKTLVQSLCFITHTHEYDYDTLLKEALDGKTSLKKTDLDRRFLPYLRQAPSLIAKMVTEKEKEEYRPYFEELILKDFNALDHMRVFYWYVYGMLAMGEKDFVPAMLDQMEKQLTRGVLIVADKIAGLCHYMQDNTVWTAMSWFAAIIALDPRRFETIFKRLTDLKPYQGNSAAIEGILTEIRYMD